MIDFTTRITLEAADVAPMYTFLLTCTDEQYNQWWPGVHLVFHTTKGEPGAVGSELYFDERVGDMRITYHATVIKADRNKEIVWHLKKIIPLPAWLHMKFESNGNKAVLTHSFRAGFGGFGRVLDPLIRVYLNRHFEEQLTKHARAEFPRLARMLHSKNSDTP